MTKTEMAIHELEKAITTFEVRLDYVQKVADSVSEIDRRLTVVEQNVRVSLLEENVKELKKESEQKDSRRWMIVVAVISCLLTLLTQAILSYLKTNK